VKESTTSAANVSVDKVCHHSPGKKVAAAAMVSAEPKCCTPSGESELEEASGGDQPRCARVIRSSEFACLALDQRSIWRLPRGELWLTPARSSSTRLSKALAPAPRCGSWEGEAGLAMPLAGVACGLIPPAAANCHLQACGRRSAAFQRSEPQLGSRCFSRRNEEASGEAASLC